MTQESFFPKQSSLDHIKFTIGLNSPSVHWDNHEQRVLTREFPEGQGRFKTSFKNNNKEAKERLDFLVLTQDRNEGSSQRGLVYKASGWEGQRGETVQLDWGCLPVGSHRVSIIKPRHSSFSIFCHLHSWSRSLGQKQDPCEFFLDRLSNGLFVHVVTETVTPHLS